MGGDMISDAGFAREFWSERLFVQAQFDAGMDSPRALAWRSFSLMLEALRRAVEHSPNRERKLCARHAIRLVAGWRGRLEQVLNRGAR
jgi:hypothetical protein